MGKVQERIDPSAGYGTRWFRTTAVFVATLAPVAGIGMSVAEGAVGMSFTATAESGEFSTLGVDASDIGLVMQPQATKDFDGGIFTQWAFEASVGNVTANKICLTEKATLLGQPVTLLITSDDPAIQVAGVSATLRQAATYAQVKGNIRLNMNAADVDSGGMPLDGVDGELGIEVDGLHTKNTTGSLQGAVIKGAGVKSFNARLIADDVSCPAP